MRRDEGWITVAFEEIPNGGRRPALFGMKDFDAFHDARHGRQFVGDALSLRDGQGEAQGSNDRPNRDPDGIEPRDVGETSDSKTSE